MTDPVRTASPAVAGMAENWPIIDALLAGTSGMRAAGKSFLPQWPNESSDGYKNRLATAVLHPAFLRTVEVLAAKPLSKAITLDETPTRLLEWVNDIDSEGRGLHAFCVDLMMDCLGKGISGVLVDHPTSPEIRTKAQEREAGVRPYFVRYPPGTVLGWKARRISGKMQLTQLRLLEQETVDDGDFGEKNIEQVRVLTPGKWEIWRAKPEKPNEWELKEEGTTSLKVIPFAFFYGVRTGFGTGKPPMLELAHQNVEHWQSSSDQQTILHVARVPILFMKGFDPKTKITVGASSAVKSANEKAEMEYVEHTGAAIDSGRQSILDLEERMRQTGAEMLVRRAGKVTATQVIGEENAQLCVLQRIAEVFDASLEQCMAFMAMWVGEKTGGTATLFKDFGAADLGEASAEFLLSMSVAGKLSNQTLFAEVQRRDLVSPDVKWDEERLRLPPPRTTELITREATQLAFLFAVKRKRIGALGRMARFEVGKPHETETR